MLGSLELVGGFIGECWGVPLHKWNPNEVCRDEDVRRSLPTRPGHCDQEARDPVFSVVC